MAITSKDLLSIIESLPDPVEHSGQTKNFQVSKCSASGGTLIAGATTEVSFTKHELIFNSSGEDWVLKEVSGL